MAQRVFEVAQVPWGAVLEKSLGKLLDRAVVRRLAAPDGVAVVAVGGSTLGGSGKTPLAIECAAELARAGARVVLVGHGYRANPRRPRLVCPDDPLDEVGDEALLAARALAPLGARVVVAPSRADAMAFAARAADVLILDGIAQLAPVPATLALLAVDATDPWGRRRAAPPPVAPVPRFPRFPRVAGLLRAPVATLVSACDAIVPMTDAEDAEASRALDGSSTPGRAPLEAAGRDMWPARVEARGAWVDEGTLMTWEAMRSLRVGLLVALARPERVVGWLGRRGVAVRAIVRGRDHGPFRAGARIAVLGAGLCGIDVWLATPKCALHAARALPRLPIGILDHSVGLDPSLRSALREIAAAACLTRRGVPNSLELLESSPELSVRGRRLVRRLPVRRGRSLAAK